MLAHYNIHMLLNVVFVDIIAQLGGRGSAVGMVKVSLGKDGMNVTEKNAVKRTIWQ